MYSIEAATLQGVILSVISIIEGTKQVYRTASDKTGLPEAFHEVALRLPIVKSILSSVEQQVRDGNIGSDSCKDMRLLADQCKTKAETLDAMFQQVLPPGDASRLDRYISAAKTLGKGSTVEILMKGLLDNMLLFMAKHCMEAATAQQIDALKKAIEDMTAVEPSIPHTEFSNTAYTNQNVGGGAITNNHVLGNQKFQANYGTGKHYLAEAQTFNMGSGRFNKQKFCAQVQQFISPLTSIDERDLRGKRENDILSQLKFDGMRDRYDKIAEVHAQTFQWIYKKPQLKFIDWLKSGNGIYWITGKAGCGKSTLMKFIFENPGTHDALPKDTLISGFFFHEDGANPLLKSQEGLFRALLYRVLSKYRQLVPIALPERWEAAQTNTMPGEGFQQISAWSLTELRAGFKSIASQDLLPLRLCLLVDGLDEFSGRYQDIVDALAELIPTSANPVVHIQLCLSSRPLVVFEKSYLQYPHLKVQDLTAGDIKVYVSTTFKKIPELKDLLLSDPTTTNQIISEILLKAEGVFLWVMLVVRSLAESLENGDDMKTLQRRLSVLPSGLESLYKRMVEQIDSFYHPNAAKIFRMVHFATKPLSPLAISFSEDDPKESLVTEKIYSDLEIADRHKKVARRLKARTAGLIEISTRGNNSVDLLDMAWLTNETNPRVRNERPWRPSMVQYLHLTVKEFLCSDCVPPWLAIHSSGRATEAHLDIAACCLRQIRVTGSFDLYDHHAAIGSAYHINGWADTATRGIIFEILFHSLAVERATNISQLEYLEVLDNLSSPEPLVVSDDWWLHKGRYWHWTHVRHRYWTEPFSWLSDFFTYLVSIGMTRSVIEILRGGYDPSAKRGLPLLLYATCNLVKDFSKGDLETDTLDPIMVEELLKRKCDPNMPIEAKPKRNEYDWETRTVWEAVLHQISQRFSDKHASIFCSFEEHHTRGPEKDTQAMHDLKLRWLKTIKLFLDHGANPTQSVLEYRHSIGDRGKRRRLRLKVSGLLIFNRVFDDFAHPLVLSIRNFMVSKGATEIDEQMLKS